MECANVAASKMKDSRKSWRSVFAAAAAVCVLYTHRHVKNGEFVSACVRVAHNNECHILLKNSEPQNENGTHSHIATILHA